MDPKTPNPGKLPHFERKRLLLTPKAKLAVEQPHPYMDSAVAQDPLQMGTTPSCTTSSSNTQEEQLAYTQYITYQRYIQDKCDKNMGEELDGINVCTGGAHFTKDNLQTIFNMPPDLVTNAEYKKRKNQEDHGEAVKKPKMSEDEHVLPP